MSIPRRRERSPIPGSAGVTSSQFQTPNLVHFNTDGLVGNDRTHEFKAFAGYQIPVIEVAANFYYRRLTGVPWAPFQRVSAGTFRWTGSLDLSLEPRGSRRNGCWYPTGLSSETGCKMQHVFDLRLEKVFNVRDNRLGLYMDAENLFNSVFPTGVQTRNPSGAVNYVDAAGHPAQHHRPARQPAHPQRGPADHVRRALELLAFRFWSRVLGSESWVRIRLENTKGWQVTATPFLLPNPNPGGP